jgi:hypothetical protein
LMKELLKQQIAWREDLLASGVHVGVPSFQPPKGLTVVSSSSSWGATAAAAAAACGATSWGAATASA